MVRSHWFSLISFQTGKHGKVGAERKWWVLTQSRYSPQGNGRQSPWVEPWNQGDTPPNAEENPGSRFRKTRISRPWTFWLPNNWTDSPHHIIYIYIYVCMWSLGDRVAAAIVCCMGGLGFDSRPRWTQKPLWKYVTFWLRHIPHACRKTAVLYT